VSFEAAAFSRGAAAGGVLKGGLLRMTLFLTAIKDLRHPEEPGGRVSKDAQSNCSPGGAHVVPSRRYSQLFSGG
jgi:hypothetical protein